MVEEKEGIFVGDTRLGLKWMLFVVLMGINGFYHIGKTGMVMFQLINLDT